MGHGLLQLLVYVARHSLDFVSEPLTAIQGQLPQARLSLAIFALLVVRSLAEAIAETQVVTYGVLPAVRSCLEEREMFSAWTKRIQ